MLDAQVEIRNYCQTSRKDPCLDRDGLERRVASGQFTDVDSSETLYRKVGDGVDFL